ncbi:MAG: glycosyltransferase family 4 protein [Vulcanisaeta sp.]
MKIVHIHRHYWPVVGGLENMVRALAEGMAKLGHEVHVITGNYGARSKNRDEEINGVHVHRIRSMRLGYPDLTYPLDRPIEVLRDADIVQAYSQNSLFTYIFAKRTKKFSKSLSIYYLGVDYLKAHYNPLIRTIGYRYEKYITGALAKLTDIALTTNKCEAEILKTHYGIRSKVVPHGIDEHVIKTPKMDREFRDKFGIEGEIIAYIGRIHPTKGVDKLINAFKHIRNKARNVDLVIAGHGDEKYIVKLRKQIQELGLEKHVHMLGKVSEKDKVGLIDAAKFLVLMSRHAGESYPLIINETLARRKPIMINKIGTAWCIGLPNIIVVNEEEFVNKAVELVMNQELYSELINSLSNFKVDELIWSNLVKRIVSIYEFI